MQKCRNCGAKFEMATRYCKRCGMPFNAAQLVRDATSQAQGVHPINENGTGSLARTTSHWRRFLGILGSGLIAMVFDRLVFQPFRTTLWQSQSDFQNPELMNFSFWYGQLLGTQWILPYLVWGLLPWILAVSAALLFLRLFRGLGTAAVLSLAFSVFVGFLFTSYQLREFQCSADFILSHNIQGSMAMLLVSLPILLAPLTLGRIRSRSAAILWAVVGGTTAIEAFELVVYTFTPVYDCNGGLSHSTVNPLLYLAYLVGGAVRGGVWAFLWIRFVRLGRFEAAMMRKPLGRISVRG